MKRLHNYFVVFVCFAILALQAQEKDPWEGSETLFPGIKLIKLEKTEPRLLKIHIVRIDLQEGRYGFFTTPKPAEWGRNMPEENAKDLKIVTRRQSAKAFMKQAHQTKEEGGYGVNMLLAVNASPWIPWKAPWNHKFACHLGLTIAQGEILDDNDLGRPSFIVYKDGKVDFRTDKNKASIKNEDLYISVPGFAVILDNGTVTPWAAGDKSLHPRTGYGLSQDRRYLYFITVDGRQKDYSIGASTGEIAEFLKEYGAYDALNMDGGGSTTLAVWNPQQPGEDGKTPDPVKIYTHQEGGWLRANANNLGIYLK